MTWQNQIKQFGEGVLNRFDEVNAGLEADRKIRRERNKNAPMVQGRMVALMADILIVVLMFSGTMMSTVHHNATLLQTQGWVGVVKIFLIQSTSQVMLLGLVTVPFLIFKQATPGMMLMGYRLRRTDRITKPGWPRCFGFFFAGCVLLGLFMVSYIGALIRPDRRAWHEVWSGTVIIRRRDIEREKNERLAQEVAEAEANSAGMAAD